MVLSASTDSAIVITVIMGALSAFSIFAIQKFVRAFYKNVETAIQRIVLSKRSTPLFILVMTLNFFFAIGMGVSAAGIFDNGDQLGIIIFDIGAIIFILGLASIISKKWKDGKQLKRRG